ncbi:hypothetical protein HC256_004203 [Beauveria bassiana]|nr:hypothetical protein HC256_004203 [Beauveria bassiana]
MSQSRQTQCAFSGLSLASSSTTNSPWSLIQLFLPLEPFRDKDSSKTYRLFRHTASGRSPIVALSTVATEPDSNWLDRFLEVFISENADGTSEVSISWHWHLSDFGIDLFDLFGSLFDVI